jgi:hypothetical protein
MWLALAAGLSLQDALEQLLQETGDTPAGDESALREALARLFMLGAVTTVTLD